MVLEELGISNELLDAFIMIVSEDAFVLEDVAAELEISVSEARLIMGYLIGNDIVRFRQVWVPIKKMGSGE